MNETFPVQQGAVVLVEERTATCTVEGCGGTVVRHSLGGGQSIDRCTRCFRRYEMRSRVAVGERSRLRRVVDEIINWRD
jgi:hypothetical protein